MRIRTAKGAAMGLACMADAERAIMDDVNWNHCLLRHGDFCVSDWKMFMCMQILVSSRDMSILSSFIFVFHIEICKRTEQSFSSLSPVRVALLVLGFMENSCRQEQYCPHSAFHGSD